MAKKSEADVVLEMYQSVMETNDKQKRLKSSTFWGLFDVKARRATVVERIASVIDKQGLKIAVKSGATFGEESDADWIILTPILLPVSGVPAQPIIPSEWPSSDWFEMMQTRIFDSEREVEAYFIAPLLEKLGYDYDDIVIGHPVTMFKGVSKTIAEADFVLFNGVNKEEGSALLVVEAKKPGKGISSDHIGQAKSYAQVLLPACYLVSDGQQIVVFQFNGMRIPDEKVMDFDRLELQNKWNDFYNYVSKKATIKRKLSMEEWLSKMKTSVPERNSSETSYK